ncbi:MAG TPA: ATP-dependent helicase, partial [Armatimonadetes bacterium]|nr:ATP-dependent helicase [Armatimonadota bacterium]
DIGYIDAVVQIGSPKSISRGVQRVGRSGHSVDRAAKGYFVALELDDLVEDFVLVRQAWRGVLDKVRIPKNCLDVLAQHLFGMAIARKWRVEDAYEVVRRSYCYADLPLDEFMSVLRFLSGRIEGLEDKGVYGKIWLDEEEGVFGRRGKLARAIYSENIGTIPENIAIKVYCGRWFVGTLEEEFVEKLLPGDVFVLGGRLFRFKRAKGLRAYVEAVKDEKPTVPAWFSELLPLSFELGEAISDFREEVWRLLAEGREEEARRRIAEEADEDVANAIVEYFKLQWSFLRAHGFDEFHSRRNLVVEHYVDERGRSNLIFHFVFGRRTNDALAKAYG